MWTQDWYTKNNFIFVHWNWTEKDIKKIIQFIIAPKRIKYLWIHLTEDCKTPWRLQHIVKRLEEKIQTNGKMAVFIEWKT